ncbi:MAG: Asp-tRNA(Asn)/Glu-tRNA(Gln) amidotransferase subunit GatC [Phycisphaerae bacterium]|nr:Asp-tRNA(Asn)/Glu-tRNA(Gln) amidotransferase subunit GatC [Phycisphaerae bacterium]
MAAVIDEEQVWHIAKLARLNLSDDEVQLFAGQLAEIFAYFRILDTVDTEGVEPLAHALAVTNVLREDEPADSLCSEKALANAPQREQGFFRVPKVLDQGSGT